MKANNCRKGFITILSNFFMHAITLRDNLRLITFSRTEFLYLYLVFMVMTSSSLSIANDMGLRIDIQVQENYVYGVQGFIVVDLFSDYPIINITNISITVYEDNVKIDVDIVNFTSFDKSAHLVIKVNLTRNSQERAQGCSEILLWLNLDLTLEPKDANVTSSALSTSYIKPFLIKVCDEKQTLTTASQDTYLLRMIEDIINRTRSEIGSLSDLERKLLFISSIATLIIVVILAHVILSAMVRSKGRELYGL